MDSTSQSQDSIASSEAIPATKPLGGHSPPSPIVIEMEIRALRQQVANLQQGQFRHEQQLQKTMRPSQPFSAAPKQTQNPGSKSSSNAFYDGKLKDLEERLDRLTDYVNKHLAKGGTDPATRSLDGERYSRLEMRTAWCEMALKMAGWGTPGTSGAEPR